ncbi:hypothetical protein R1flu_016555 [Riccia fluitans]|uniref:Uncharacterized protein n=1 Tax=Riccia fluitans TaxID=41844 RepID=A0ABD1YQA6_9MARC
MARNEGMWQKVKKTISSEIQDDEKLAANLRLLRAVALFAGSVFVMRNFGELMAVDNFDAVKRKDLLQGFVMRILTWAGDAPKPWLDVRYMEMDITWKRE